MAQSRSNLRHNADSIASLGPVLSRRRKDLGLTQEELADLAGVALRLVHELEHDKVTVRLDNLLRLVNALGLHLELARGTANGVVTKNVNTPTPSNNS
jgi:HTH-type transcriptional regulator/antitoxin HipB